VSTTPVEHLRGSIALLQLIERAQRELLDAGQQLERDAWALRHKIETALRPVRKYLERQPIGDVVDVLTALGEAERLILAVPHLTAGDAKLPEIAGAPRRRRRGA
jgi:hypothetical protein